MLILIAKYVVTWRCHVYYSTYLIQWDLRSSYIDCLVHTSSSFTLVPTTHIHPLTYSHTERDEKYSRWRDAVSHCMYWQGGKEKRNGKCMDRQLYIMFTTANCMCGDDVIIMVVSHRRTLHPSRSLYISIIEGAVVQKFKLQTAVLA